MPSYTTGTICNGLRTIAVGAYNPHSPGRELAPFSSCGPTRDDRVKPDLIAPGESILAARSAPRDPRAEVPPWTLMSGTSMAAPHVAGMVACMFQAAERPLRIEETRNLLLANTERMMGPEVVPDRVGSGYLDIARAVEAARRIGSSAPQLQPSLYRKTEGDTVNRENDISSTETWDPEFRQDIGESNELDDPEVSLFEDTETAEVELHDDERELATELNDQQLFEGGAGREAYSNPEPEFGRELVELADEIICAGSVHSPGALLNELLSKAGAMAAVQPLEATHINHTSPAALFDAFTSDKLPGLRDYFNRFFEVVAFPGSRIVDNFQSGDCCVRRALGEGNMAHMALLVTGEALRAQELASMGLRPESRRPGPYAEVIDAGPFPHRLEDTFARCLGNGNGQLSHDSLILRIPQSESPLSLARVGALGEGAEYETDEQPYDPYVLEKGDTSTRFEEVMPEPAKTKREEVRDRPQILVVDDKDEPVTDGEYAFHQGELSERGKFSEERKGRAYFSKIDPTQPFVFEVRDRVCAIRAGAFFNPDDPKIEYGGTWFDWTLVRDDKQADKNFWSYYQQEMDFAAQAESYETAQGRRLERFLQHEHITRRPIRVAKPFLAQLSKVRIRATPARVRVGPFVRYADHERAVIWLETVTPTMVRVRYKKAGGGTESSRYTSTVRVGGRHFAAVEIDGLEKDKFYDYTVELAPLPATGAIPIAQKNSRASSRS